MGQAWRDHPAWSLVEQAEGALHRDLSTMLLDAEHPPSGTTEAHIAVVLCSMMAWSTLEAGLKPVALAGHSLGLVSALHAAGTLSAEDVVTVVAMRAEVTERACGATPGGMAAVQASADVAEAACADTRCWVANDNTPQQTVISGTLDGIEAATTAALALGARDVIPLDIAGSFHSPLMRQASVEFAKLLDDVEFREPCHVLVHNAHIYRPGDRIDWASLVANDLITPVRWRETQLAFAAHGANSVVEVGFGRTLTGLAKRTVPELLLCNAGSPDAVADILARTPSAQVGTGATS
jgi:[acyl-carrier-protein] S-malonyltransferase